MIDASDRHPGVQSVLRLLDSQHLPDDDLAKVSRLFEDTASQLLALLPRDGARLTAALVGLWQVKNDAVGHAVLCRDEVSGRPATTLVIGETSTGIYPRRDATRGETAQAEGASMSIHADATGTHLTKD